MGTTNEKTIRFKYRRGTDSGPVRREDGDNTRIPRHPNGFHGKMRIPNLSGESGNDLPKQNKNQIEKPPHMKKWYKVTVKATIIKTQDIHATSQEAAEQEAMELFNPHSGEAEEHYTQEVISISKTK